MRKALIAVITASALFAIGAFATTFDVTSGNIASGSDTVEACADEATVDYTTQAAFDGTEEDFIVTTITVTFLDSANAATTSCDGAVVDLATGDGDPVTWTQYTSTTASGTTATFSSLTTPVGEIDVVSVLADDESIPAT